MQAFGRFSLLPLCARAVPVALPTVRANHTAAAMALPSGQHVSTQWTSTAGIAEVQFRRPPVNAMSVQVLKEIQAAFESLSSHKDVKAVLLTAETPKVFSAGLDLKENAKFTKKDVWEDYIRLIEDSLGSPALCKVPVAAAVTGHALAGGMVIACACDFIALQRKSNAKTDYVVGVTEVAVGVPFPRAAIELVRHSVGLPRSVRRFCLEGVTVSPSEAFDMGFGDVLVDDARAEAMVWLQRALQKPAAIVQLAKKQVNYPLHQQTDKPSKVAGTASRDYQVTEVVESLFDRLRSNL